MAVVSFSFRSKKAATNLEVRLTVSIEGKRTSFYTRTKLLTSADFWKMYAAGKIFRDADKIRNKEILDREIASIRNFILEEVNKTDLQILNSKWLKKCITAYYSAVQAPKLPTSLIGYWNHYLELRKHEIQQKISSWKKWITVRNKVMAFEQGSNRTFQIAEIDDLFKSQWVEYCNSMGYSIQTTKKEFAYIKTICLHAKSMGLMTHPNLPNLKISVTTPKILGIYFKQEEINQIAALESLPENLSNARDWLIISCYTGQRISDFMRFKPDMLREDSSGTYIDFRQVKTGKNVTVPILPPVIKILRKRSGEFPRPISDQKYNVYIKEIAKLAGIKEKISGSKRIGMRNIIGQYEKWKLVSSHIGRRSFATNYYGKIPTSFLMNITGHGTEKTLLGYIGKSPKDTAMEAYQLLMKQM